MAAPTDRRCLRRLPQWLAERCRALGLAAALLPGLVPGVAMAAEPAPLYTAKPRFRIPFQFDSAEMKRLGAVSIELHASTDFGRTWNLEQTVEPTAGKFSFEAKSNGEYWFAVRTVDGRQRRHPEGPLDPGLRVIVDTKSPTISLNVEPLGRNRVSLSWDAIDDNLDLSGLSIEWRDDADSQWQSVSILPAASGQTSWSSRGTVEVRATVRDLAGNTAEASDSTARDSGLEAPQLPSLPASSPPSRSKRNTEPDFSKPVAEAPFEDQAKPFPEVQTAQAPEADASDALPVVRSKTGGGDEFRAPPRQNQKLTSDHPLTRPPAGQDAWEPSNSGFRVPAAPVSTSQTFTAEATRRAVRSRSFKIGYQVDDVGPSGVATVDLYITENNGQKWFHYGSDADRESPFEVVVPGDGEYGFAIRVQSGSGIAVDPPQPGDPPEMRIVVDQAPPVARVMPLRQGQGAALNQILIEWSVSDSHLAEQPVSLSYSENARGPWTPITDWTDNTGRHVWTVKEPMQKRIYVRLEARDAAGNRTETLADQPIVIDLARPTARIVDVEAEVRPQ